MPVARPPHLPAALEDPRRPVQTPAAPTRLEGQYLLPACVGESPLTFRLLKSASSDSILGCVSVIMKDGHVRLLTTSLAIHRNPSTGPVRAIPATLFLFH